MYNQYKKEGEGVSRSSLFCSFSFSLHTLTHCISPSAGDWNSNENISSPLPSSISIPLPLPSSPEPIEKSKWSTNQYSTHLHHFHRNPSSIDRSSGWDHWRLRYRLADLRPSLQCRLHCTDGLLQWHYDHSIIYRITHSIHPDFDQSRMVRCVLRVLSAWQIPNPDRVIVNWMDTVI